MPARERSPRRAFFSSRGVIGVVVVALLAVGAAALSAAALTPSAPPTWTLPTPTDTPATDEPERVVFLGDSYTQGVGASAPAARWTSLLSAAEGWTEINLGRGGTGFVTTASVTGCGLDYCPSYGEMLAAAAEQKPDILVIAGGQNDFGAFVADPVTVTAAIDQVYADARAAFPDIPIIAVGPSSPGGETDTVVDFDAAVQAAAASVGAQYISLLFPAVVEPSLVLPDGAHVGDAGHQAIADRIKERLTL
ncbi:SGNH/GDSL hydrolase family protein [Amnibacterium flavum]|uniref:SGNH/GDSL hydrolase family protein n=1 Tax=Amnibacterium flavum TaxID=2173173 RepID=A0A2V1HZ30_9MICO|nr:SGNH/GDSL hydrolase family protein [Amnibacterium flavum]PVZ95884.1 SGNH/GDSL hydrolase family protein [Amnibacterium flavum]